MNDVSHQAFLLAVFNETFEKINGKGYKHSFFPEDEHKGAPARCIVSTVALMKGDTRLLAEIDRRGIVRPFAQVNGRGVVETVGDVSLDTMSEKLQRTGDAIKRSTPSNDGGLYHYSVRGPSKVY